MKFKKEQLRRWSNRGIMILEKGERIMSFLINLVTFVGMIFQCVRFLLLKH